MPDNQNSVNTIGEMASLFLPGFRSHVPGLNFSESAAGAYRRVVLDIEDGEMTSGKSSVGFVLLADGREYQVWIEVAPITNPDMPPAEAVMRFE